MTRGKLYYGERTPRRDLLAESMHRIDTTPSWQIIIGSILEDNLYRLVTISRGPVPRLKQGIFAEISEMVKIDELGDGGEDKALIDYGLEFKGDEVAMEIFTDLMANQLAQGAEGNRDIIAECGGPVILISAFLGGTATQS